MQNLMQLIADVLPEGGEWCTVDKAQKLSAMLITLRPTVVVEIGVWMGGSAIPMALTLKHLNQGKIICIDPWDKFSSVLGLDPINANWWGQVDHNRAYRSFMNRLEKHDLFNYVEVKRSRSDDISPPNNIGLLHIDGNHGEQAIRDVSRFAPKVSLGGFVILDDIEWIGGSVTNAASMLVGMGFTKMYAMDNGMVYQRWI